MQTVADYREQARECIELAEKMQGSDKQKLLAIADAWSRLAAEAAKETEQGRIVRTAD